MFAEAAEEILADVAELLEEVEAKQGQVVFEKGAAGDSLYIVLSGRVRVYDGARTIVELGDKEIFGELALLDPEPRVASVAAVEDTRLFRLDREAFAELMAGNIEIVRGVLHVLCERLRALDSYPIDRRSAGQGGAIRIEEARTPVPHRGGAMRMVPRCARSRSWRHSSAAVVTAANAGDRQAQPGALRQPSPAPPSRPRRQSASAATGGRGGSGHLLWEGEGGSVSLLNRGQFR